MATAHLPFLTPEQYRDLENHSEMRHEYMDGVMYAMAGGSDNHAELSAAIAGELRSALRGRGCHVFGSDRRTAVSETAYFYPDASVICGDNLSREPILIVEVLSGTTDRFDRTAKFNRYKEIASLREYVLISQTAPLVETHLRGEDGRWTATRFEGIDAICRLASLKVDIPLSSLYEGIDLNNPA